MEYLTLDLKSALASLIAMFYTSISLVQVTYLVQLGNQTSRSFHNRACNVKYCVEVLENIFCGLIEVVETGLDPIANWFVLCWCIVVGFAICLEQLILACTEAALSR